MQKSDAIGECRLSIIIPFYNTSEELFKKCFSAIESQIGVNDEIVIIDDGSDHKYVKMLEEVTKENRCVRIIRQSNMGVSVARNNGLKNANGAYLMFIDSDDIVGEGWIERSITYAEKYDADIIIGNIVICSKMEPTETEKSSIPDDILVFEKANIATLEREMLTESTDIIPRMRYIDYGSCAKLMRRSITDGLSFPDGIKLSEDQVFIFTAIRNSKKVVLTNYPSYYYIVNISSASHHYHANAVQTMMKAMTMVKESLYENDQVYQAFHTHTLCELQRAFSLSCKGGIRNIKKNTKLIKTTCLDPQVKESRSQACVSLIRNKTVRCLVCLIKYRLAFCYALFIFIINSQRK